MKIGINITPLKTAHKDRGIGYYTDHLVESLKKDKSLEIKEFTNINDSCDVDIVHYPWFDFYFHTLPIKKIVKTVVTIHDAIPLVFPEHYKPGLKGKINFKLQKFSLRSVKAIITDSEVSKKDIVNYLKINAELIHTIPLAADKDFQAIPENRLLEVKSRFNLSDQFLLYVGDANWVKNLPFLIEGFNKIQQNQKNLKLVLVGEVFLKKVENINHPELISLKKVNELIKEYNLGNSIIRPGKVEKDDLVYLYNLATAYVQPSFYEGFGLPVLEAMSSGTPVISSKSGSLKEVGGEAAIYFDPGNLQQFVKLVEEILVNSSLQNKLSNQSLKQALRFNWEKVAHETKVVYEKVINE